MKSILKLFFLGMVCVTLRADILRLRDGRMITGQFMGATQTEIWFKSETPGDVFGAAAYRVEEVESLTFGPAPGSAASGRGSVAGDDKVPATRHWPPADDYPELSALRRIVHAIGLGTRP